MLSGGVWLSDRMSSALLGRLAQGRAAGSDSPLAALSDRELEIFQKIGQGHSIKDIAVQLNLSAKTVEVHREHIKEKLSLNSSAELLRYAVIYALEDRRQ